METAYAVLWQEGDGPQRSGRLELHGAELRLENGSTDLEIPYRDLVSVSVGRGPRERLAGKPALALDRRCGDRLLVAPVAQAGLLGELAERVTELQVEAHADTRIAVVVPIKEHLCPIARSLVADGPPFDPDLAGLARHEVFVTDTEVVFVFETPDGSDGLDRILGEPWLWRAAAEWAEVIAGPPRVATAAYVWAGPGSATVHVGLGF